MTPIQELDLFNRGYDTAKGELDSSLITRLVCKAMPRPDKAKAETMIKAGYEYYLLECDAMDDGARLPYRP